MNELTKKNTELFIPDPIEGDAWYGVEWLLRRMNLDADYSGDRNTCVVESHGAMLSIGRMEARNVVQYITDGYARIYETMEEAVKCREVIRVENSRDKHWIELIAVPDNSQNKALYTAKSLYVILKRRYSMCLEDSREDRLLTDNGKFLSTNSVA